MQNSVCIVGVSALTSIGLNAPATAASARAGIAHFNEHPYMIDREGVGDDHLEIKETEDSTDSIIFGYSQ